ncbi:MAG: hypothetical protein ACJAYR_001299 [Sneathiella sp.]|jgi:hypothetical protein
MKALQSRAALSVKEYCVRFSLLICFFCWFGTSAFLSTRAVAEDVDLHLVLAVDVSSSINYDEFGLQIRGYANAFRSAEVQQAIQSGVHKKIAVLMTQWAGLQEQKVVIGWTALSTVNDAEQFAEKIDYLSRSFPFGGTAIAPALEHAWQQFATSPHKSARRVIDLSGDGRISIGPSLEPIRETVVANGVVINGLAILNEAPDLDQYYRKNLIGGRGAFVQVANDLNDFPLAIQKKLAREIRGIWYGV